MPPDLASYVAARRPALLRWARAVAGDPVPLADPTDRLWDLVLELPPQQSAAVALRYYEQLSVAETAAVLGCSTGTVTSNTSRGIAALRRLATHR